MSNAKKLKSDILKILSNVDDVNLLKSVRNQLINSDKEGEDLPFLKAVKPVKKRVTLEQIMKEQNCKPITYQECRAKADNMETALLLTEALRKTIDEAEGCSNPGAATRAKGGDSGRLALGPKWPRLPSNCASYQKTPWHRFRGLQETKIAGRASRARS